MIAIATSFESVKINGVQHNLWRAVDHEGEVLESYVTKTRDKQAALTFFEESDETIWITEDCDLRTAFARMARQ